MLLVIAIVATLLAFIQNSILFEAGMKEMAIAAFPLSFTGIFLVEIALIWTAFFCVPKILRQSRELALAGCALLILGAAELALPASFFTKLIQQAGRRYQLQRIREVGASIEPLRSDDGGIRFALTYTLQFPKTGHYLTFPAYLGPQEDQVFGNYFWKLHPEYDDEKYVYEAGKPYSFIVVFDTKEKAVNISEETANIDLCDGKDYFMACRTIRIGLNGAPAALATPAPAGKLEPDLPADNIPDMTEKNIRLARLAVPETNKSGEPMTVSFEITNAGNRDLPIPGDNLGNVISIQYGWEAVSGGAKQAEVSPGTANFRNAVTGPTAQFVSIPKSTFAAGESVATHNEVKPFEPLAPGQYRLHVSLFSRYATDSHKPEEELVQTFSVEP